MSPACCSNTGAGAAPLPIAKLGRGFHDLGTIDLKPEPVILSGTVVDDRGKPVQNASVRRDLGGSRQSVFTDTDGRFTIRKLELEPMKKFGVSVSAKGHEPTSEPQFFSYGAKDVRVVLRRVN